MQIINTGISEISFDRERSILHMHVIQGAEMTLESSIRHYEMIHKLVEGNQYAALINSGHYFTITPEALKFTASPEALKYRVAAAHYNLNLANKITTTFFIANCDSIPVRNFGTYDEALHWLSSILAEKGVVTARAMAI